MAVSKAQQKAVTKYVKSKYDRFGLTMPKGNLDTIKAHADSQGQSVNAYINTAIENRMAQEATGEAVGAGGILVSPDTLESAQQAAERTGEPVGVFVSRAVDMQVERDGVSFRMGINPVTGSKLVKKEGKENE